MKWLYFVIIVFLLSACEEPVDLLDLPDDSGKPVVMCNFTRSKPFVVFLSKTKSSLDTDPTVDYIKDASVRIFRNEYQQNYLSFVDEKAASPVPYYYSNALEPSFSVPYFLEVELNNGLLLTAKSSIPRPSEVKIKSFSVARKKISHFSTRVDFTVKIEVQDPLYTVNYYQLNFYQKIIQHRFGGDTTIVEGPLNVEFDVPNLPFIAHFDGSGILFDDTTFDGQNKTLVGKGSFVYNSNQELDDFFVELISGSKEYYNYLSSLSRQLATASSPLAEAVVIDHNIKNGYGVFAGYSTSIDSTFTGN